MKKKIFVGIAVLAIAAAATVNVNLSAKSNDLSSISLINGEALAENESYNNNYFAIEYSTNSYCIDENGCYVFTTTVTTSCMHGGYSSCYSGSFSYTDVICP